MNSKKLNIVIFFVGILLLIWFIVSILKTEYVENISEKNFLNNKHDLLNKIYDKKIPGINNIIISENNFIWYNTDTELVCIDLKGNIIFSNKMEFNITSMFTSDKLLYAAEQNIIYRYDFDNGFSKKQIIKLSDKSYITNFSLVNDKIYIADFGEKKIFCFDSSGNKVWETSGKDKFVLPGPSFMFDISGDNELWVSNGGNKRLEKLDLKTGAFIAEWKPIEKTAFPGCCNPSWFKCLENGRFLIFEKGNPRLSIYEPSGIISKNIIDDFSYSRLNYKICTEGNKLFTVKGNKIYTVIDNTIYEVLY